ncbi:MAG: DinB family protein [Anaerolineales bacterium]|nr:DinB family protein [Anaerolineales bacterium]
MNRVEKLVQTFLNEGQKTLDFFNQLPEDAWPLQLYSDGAQWCIREVLAHIVDTESSLLQLFEDIRDGGRGLTQNIDIDEYNAKSVAILKGLPPQELLDEFKFRRKRMTKFVASLSEEDLGLEGKHPFLGETTLEEMLRLFYLHVNLHIRDVRTLIKEQLRSGSGNS